MTYLSTKRVFSALRPTSDCAVALHQSFDVVGEGQVYCLGLINEFLFELFIDAQCEGYYRFGWLGYRAARVSLHTANLLQYESPHCKYDENYYYRTEYKTKRGVCKFVY